jgi:cytoskeletal protein CcmA (bactofilin family)
MSGEEKRKEYEKRLQGAEGIPTTHISGSGKVHVEGKGDIRISGSGYVSPEEIKISGSGKLPGGLKVKAVRCSGSVSVEGDIEADDMSLSGSASVDGRVTAKTLSCAGSFSVHGEVKADLLETTGSFRAGNGVELGDTLRAAGSVRVGGNIRAKNLVSVRGFIDVDGKVVADRFEVRLGRGDRSESQVLGGVQAVNVIVKKKDTSGMTIFNLPLLRRLFPEGRLHTTDIAAEGKVFLENVSCDNVRGRDVTIVEGCTIRGKVSYSGTVSVHSSARLAFSPEKMSIMKG